MRSFYIDAACVVRSHRESRLICAPRAFIKGLARGAAAFYANIGCAISGKRTWCELLRGERKEEREGGREAERMNNEGFVKKRRMKPGVKVRDRSISSTLSFIHAQIL